MEAAAAEAAALLKAENERRYVALRDFFLRLANDIFPLHQDFPDQGPLDADLKQVRLAQNPFPEAVLALPLQAVKAAVLGLLQPTPDPAELPSDKAHRPPASSETRAPFLQTDRPEAPWTEEPSSAGATAVPRPLEAPKADKGLAILGGESKSRADRVELVESLEPLRTSLCDEPLPPDYSPGWQLAVVDAEVPNSALLCGSRAEQSLRVTFRPEKTRVMKTKRVTEKNWDGRHGSAGVWAEGRIYVAGGINGGDAALSTNILALGRGGEAPVMAALRTGRYYNALLAFAGGLVAVGGRTERAEPLASVEGFWLGGGDGEDWVKRRTLPDLPRPLHTMGAVVFKGRLFVAGGADSGGVSDDVFSLGPGLERWEWEGRLTRPRCGLSLVVLGGRLYALGGVFRIRDKEESWSRNVEVFEEENRRWHLLPGELHLLVNRSLALPLS